MTLRLSNVIICLFSFILSLLILCSCDESSGDGATDPTNHAPVFESVTANPASIKFDESTILTCVATDADGDNLTYTWSAPSGSFPNGTSGASVTWTAPTEAGNVSITVTANDGVTSADDNVQVTVEWSCSGTITYEGKSYGTVQIGSQCWFSENLNVGTRIDGGQSQSNNSLIEKYCYDNDPANCTKYGGLYRWDESMQHITTSAQGICPDGWHIPTMAEFEILIAPIPYNSNALKAIGEGTGDGAGTNTTGFSALIAGTYDYSFRGLGIWTEFWASNEIGATISIYADASYFGRGHSGSAYSYNVRCLKD